MLRKVVSLILCFALLATPSPAVAGTWDDIGNAWAKTKSTYDTAKVKTKDAWNKTSEASGKAYDATAEWCGEHQEEIAEVAVTAVVITLYAAFGQEAPPPSKSQPGYSGVKSPSKVAAGQSFTQAQKTQFFDANRARNNGVLRSDLSGKVLQPAVKHVKGYTPPLNEAHVDHIIPKSLGGSNSPSNAQILSRSENLSKGATAGASP